MPNSRFLIIVPAWNEEAALSMLFPELAEVSIPHDVVVVDDGSTDRTSEVAKAHGVTVLTLPVNLGVGGAMRAGYRWALRNGYGFSIQVDADGQHRPCDIAPVVEKVFAGELDLCIGARFAGVGEYRAGGLRRGVMALLAWLISGITGTRLTDTTSGFKAANLRAMRVFAQDFPMEYLGDTVEALIIGHKAGLRIGQVPVEMRERQAGSASHAPWRSAVFLVRALLAVFVALTRQATKAEGE